VKALRCRTMTASSKEPEPDIPPKTPVCKRTGNMRALVLATYAPAF
jgi:hypothetical protein